MLSTYNISTQDVTTNGLLNFTTDRILTGCTATRSGNTIQLNKPGYYYVSFNAVGSATNTVGELSVSLQNNGVTVSGAMASVTTTVAGNNSALAFSTIVRVQPSCCSIDNTAKLTFVNTGVDGTYINGNVNVTKIC